MKVRFGMSEMIVVFSAAMLWHSVLAASCVFGFACLCGFFRYAIELNEQTKRTQAAQDASKIITEQAEDLGNVLGQFFSFAAKENKKKDDGTVH